MDPASMIRRAGGSYARNVAVRFEGRDQTYAQLFERACRLANALRRHGAVAGDRIALLSDNAFETAEQAASCALGNFARATLYTYHGPAVNRYLLELIGARILLVQAKYLAGLQPLLADLPDLKAIILFGGDVVPGTVDYEAALAGENAADVLVPVHDDDPHIIRFSSGTTGKPKGIYHSVARWIQVTNEWRWVTPMLDERSRYLVPCALAHLGVALFSGVLAVGGCILPMPAFDARRTLELMARERITHMAVVPVMIRDMLNQPECRNLDFSALQCMLYAGSPIAGSTLRAAVEAFGASLHQLYSQSETMLTSMLLPHQHVLAGSETELRRLRSVGRPSANVRVTIRDDDGHCLPAGEIGEIAAEGPNTMSGLWNNPAATVARMLPGGAVLTRDMGYLDEDGFLYLVDRKDDMIISGGYNIWPTELEQALCAHPAVTEACVFGIPDAKWGETPKAVVVLKPDARATPAALIAHTKELVGSIKKITSVDFVAVLPRTAAGKVQRSALKDPYWADHASRVAGS